MWHYWGVEAAPQICLRFSFRVRSFGVALCWNSKDYWHQKEVAARTFLTIGKTIVIITVSIWCLPRIHDFLLVLHWCRDIWLQIEGNQEVPSIPVIAHEILRVCVPIYRWVSIIFSAEFNFTVSCFDLYLYIRHITETKKKLLAVLNIMFYKVYILMSYNCSSFGSPAEALVILRSTVHNIVVP
jgi:hypothetical protein